jgi:hypothetical protein
MWESQVAGVLVYDPQTRRVLLGEERDGWGPFAGRRERGDADAIATALREVKEESCDALRPTRAQFDAAHRGTLMSRTPRGLTCALFVLVPWWSTRDADPVPMHAERLVKETRAVYMEKRRLNWFHPESALRFRAQFGADLARLRPLLRAVVR